MLIRVRPKMVIHRLRTFLLSQLGGEEVHYIQVGANDGSMDDPIYKIAQQLDWSGLLIEPHPKYFAELTWTYANRDGFQLLNCGVSDESGALELHYVKESAEEKYPAWARGCASINRARLEDTLSRVAKPLDSDIGSVTIPVRRLDEIIETENLNESDLLVVDVEGHEMSVLRSFDLTKFHPKAILIESTSRIDDQDTEIRAHLTQAGYSQHRFGGDIFAFSEDFPRIDPSDMISLVGLERLDPDQTAPIEAASQALSDPM